MALDTIRPVTSETATPRVHRGADRVDRPRPDDQVVADQRPVDVEGDQADRERRLGRADGGGPRRVLEAHAGARSTHRDPRQAGQVRLDAAAPARAAAPPTSATIASPWSAPISRQGDPAVGETPRQPVEQPPDHRRARPRRRRGRAPARRRPRPAAPPSRRRGRRAGWRATMSHGSVVDRRQEVGRRRTGPGPPTPWPTAFSRARSSASGEMSVASDRDLVDRTRRRRRSDGERDRDRAAARPDVERPAAVVARPAARPSASRRMISLERQVDEPLGLGSRDERPRVDGEGEPVELLDAADVGDRLAGRPPVQRGPERPPRRPARPARRGGRRSSSGRRRPRSRAAARRRAAASRTRPPRSRSMPSRQERPRSVVTARVAASEPDRDGDVADLAQHLGARGPAPAMEQQVDRRLADAQVRERDLAEPVGQVRVAQLELAAVGVRPGGRASSSGTGTTTPPPRPAASRRPGTGPGCARRSRSKPQNSSGSR